MAVPGLQGLFDSARIKEPVSWLTKGVFLLRFVMPRCFVVSDFCQVSVKVEHFNVQDIIFLKGIFSLPDFNFSSHRYKYKDHVQDSCRTRLVLTVIILFFCDNSALTSLSHESRCAMKESVSCSEG